jgi:hypothetical protein
MKNKIISNALKDELIFHSITHIIFVLSTLTLTLDYVFQMSKLFDLEFLEREEGLNTHLINSRL